MNTNRFYTLDKYHIRVSNKNLLTGMIKEVGCSAYAVYSVIAMFQDWNTKTAYPTQKTIRFLTGLSKPTIIKALQTLQEKNYIKIHKRPAKNKLGTPAGRDRCFYKILK